MVLYSDIGISTTNGIFIPLIDLKGLTLNEITTEEEKRDGRLLLAIMEALSKQDINILGFNIHKSHPKIINDFLNIDYTFNTTKVLDVISNTITAIPEPIETVDPLKLYFPHCETILIDDIILEPGVIIEFSTLNLYGLTELSLNRLALYSILQWIIFSTNIFKVRSFNDSIKSGILVKRNTKNVIIDLEPSAYLSVGSTTGLLESQKHYQLILKQEYIITIQLSLESNNMDINLL